KPILLLLGTVAMAGAQPTRYLDLAGAWRISADDRPEYAQKDFDDSSWQTVVLPWGDLPPTGKHWLRRTVELPKDFDPSDLTVRLGPVADSYELYLNGQLAASTGGFESGYAVRPQQRQHRIPAAASATVAGSKLDLAIRIWRPEGLRFNSRGEIRFA